MSARRYPILEGEYRKESSDTGCDRKLTYAGRKRNMESDKGGTGKFAMLRDGGGKGYNDVTALRRKKVMALEIAEILRLDKEMYDLKGRLKMDPEFSERFYKELEELKQIRLPISEDDKTEFEVQISANIQSQYKSAED